MNEAFALANMKRNFVAMKQTSATSMKQSTH